jgi:hypothetical protein
MPQSSKPTASWEDASSMLPSGTKLRSRQLASGPAQQRLLVAANHRVNLQETNVDFGGFIGATAPSIPNQPVYFRDPFVSIPSTFSDTFQQAVESEGQVEDLGGEGVPRSPLSPEAKNWMEEADKPLGPYPSPPTDHPTQPEPAYPIRTWDLPANIEVSESQESTPVVTDLTTPSFESIPLSVNDNSIPLNEGLSLEEEHHSSS